LSIIKLLNAMLELRQAFIRAIIISLCSSGINRQLNNNNNYLISLISAIINSIILEVNRMSILK
jgi:hypothetical protein